MQHRAARVLLVCYVSCRFWVHSTQASSPALRANISGGARQLVGTCSSSPELLGWRTALPSRIRASETRPQAV
jgi:hypothetical protein